MKLLFKSLVLILIISNNVSAQKKYIYNKVFETNKNTIAILNLENTTVSIEPSIDGKMYFDYNLEFENYSKEEIEKLSKEINIKATLFDDNITLKAKSITRKNVSFAIETKKGLKFSNGFFNNKNNSSKIYRKTKDSIVKTINKNPLDDLKKFLTIFKEVDNDGNEKEIKPKNVKIKKSHFIIKIPNYIKLIINAKDSQITFTDSFINEITLNLKRGLLKTVTLANSRNRIKIDDAAFKAQTLIGGDYTLTNITLGLIGSIERTNITSEFSKIEIGLINKENVITDFNSELWFYNFSNNFNRFDLFSEYSKIHLFYPNDDFSFDVFGNNTINHLDNIKIEMQPTKNGEKHHMISRKPKGGNIFSGHINFDIIHGIIYSHNDTFILNKTKAN